MISLPAFNQNEDYRFSRLDMHNGLSHNLVNCIYKDVNGFIWIGTMSGLNKFDGYTCKIFKYNELDSTSIYEDEVSGIFEGPGRNLWIKTRNRFNILDPSTEKFDRRPESFLQQHGLPSTGLNSILKNDNSYFFIYADKGVYRLDSGIAAAFLLSGTGVSVLAPSFIADAQFDSKGFLWVVFQSGLLKKLDILKNEIVIETQKLQQLDTRSPLYYNMFIDNSDELWFFANSKLEGVYWYDPLKNAIKHFTKDTGPCRLNNDLIRSIMQDERGLIWIGTDHGGINIIDKEKQSITYVTNKEGDEKSLSQNCIITLYRDNLGIMMAGTFKQGINFYSKDIIRFPLYKKNSSNISSLPYNDVNCFAEDEKGNLWIGTNGGGLIFFDRKKNIFRQYKHDRHHENSLSNDVIVSLCIDHQKKLWIGTYFGGMQCFDGRIFKSYHHNDADPTSIADERIWRIYEDDENNLWVGTFDGGLDRLDRGKNIFYHHNKSMRNSIRSNYISSIADDSNGRLWLGTDKGIELFDKRSGNSAHYTNAKHKLVNENVSCLLLDHKKNLWAGTREGLAVLQPGKKEFSFFRTREGLPDNVILCIQEDKENNLWVSTPNGLSRILVNQEGSDIAITCANYDKSDGLQGRSFNEKSSFITKAGELIFGGANGFNLFKSSEIKSGNNIPSIVFTDFRLFNQNVQVGERINNTVVLKKIISETNEITLPHNQNDFSIQFAALSFINTEMTRYAYMLEGFDKTWITTDGNTRKATYANLGPGTYSFRVKASNDAGIWNEKNIPLKIIILPPFWKTPLAYLLYGFILVVVLLFARRMTIQKARMRFELEQERKEIHRLHELDMMKIRFFTNINHELKTPLSLILSPIEKLIKNPNDPDPQKEYHLIYRNTRRLLNMVNQLFDFRKMEANELKLNSSANDIIKFLKDISHSFTDLAERKHIDFSFESNIAYYNTVFDQDKIERVLFNLLSNAFKFTPENGKIRVMVNDASGIGEEALLEIKIKDNGIGIAPANHEKIFDLFFQSDIPQSMLNQGSGIGLSIVKQFVKMHSGTITVESEPGRGSCFVVLLPLKEIITAPENLLFIEKKMNEIEKAEPVGSENNPMAGNNAIVQTDRKKPIVLLVEDNEEFRFYLKDNLQLYFTIVEASDGKAGWQKALALHPDLVLSDVSMPEMDGIALCKKIRDDQRTRQVPVILLTAMAGEELQIKGLEKGATDFMTKPFNFEILLSKIKNMLQYNETIKQTYQKQIQANPAEIALESEDQKFIRRALDLVEKNIDNPDFSVEDLSAALYCSRATLYKKLLELTGKTPIEFVRLIRLKRAAQLLEKSQLPVSEIAYKVGFNNPKYFAKYFKAQFNMPPSSYKAEKERKKMNNTIPDNGFPLEVD